MCLLAGAAGLQPWVGAALGPTVAGQQVEEKPKPEKTKQQRAEQREQREQRAQRRAKAKAAAEAKRAERAKQKTDPAPSQQEVEQPSGYLQDLIRRTIKHGPTGKPATPEEAKQNAGPIEKPTATEPKKQKADTKNVRRPRPGVALPSDAPSETAQPYQESNESEGPDLGFEETPVPDEPGEQSPQQPSPQMVTEEDSPTDVTHPQAIAPESEPEDLPTPDRKVPGPKPEVIEPDTQEPAIEAVPRPEHPTAESTPMFDAPKIENSPPAEDLVPLDLPLYPETPAQDEPSEPAPIEIEPDFKEESEPEPATRFDPPPLKISPNEPIPQSNPVPQSNQEEQPQPQPIESAPSEVETPIGFPPLPPDPYADRQPKLAPLECELHHHGGSYLYQPEGDAFQQHQQAAHCDPQHHHAPLRLPEHFQAPQPCTHFAEYLGADPIQLSPYAWKGPGGYQWEPRLVAHGRYDVFGIAFEEGGVRQDGFGHNLTLDADLRLTGTERIHLQHRPIGEDGSGGSFYRFDNPQGYIDNSTAEPARIWLEGEVASILSGWLNDPTQAWDMNFAVGKFPLGLHNNLLINDEVAGVIVGQNNRQEGNLSNLNTRLFWLWDDVNSFDEFGSEVFGADAFIDYQHAFIETTYAYRKHGRTSNGDAHYLAGSATQFYGPAAVTLRAMAKIADSADSDGQLYVMEYNTHRKFDDASLWSLLPRSGIHHGVIYVNAFYATKGWSPIASANFNRIRSSFEVNPLVLVARGDRDDTPGVAAGVQLFGEQDDSSLTPEIAWEAPGGRSIFGTGLRYQRRTSVSSFLELRGLINFSEDHTLDRDGLFGSHHWLF